MLVAIYNISGIQLGKISFCWDKPDDLIAGVPLLPLIYYVYDTSEKWLNVFSPKFWAEQSYFHEAEIFRNPQGVATEIKKVQNCLGSLGKRFPA